MNDHKHISSSVSILCADIWEMNGKTGTQREDIHYSLYCKYQKNLWNIKLTVIKTTFCNTPQNVSNLIR
jgi:hypothetical protein